MTQILLSYVFFVPQISQIYTDLDQFGLWGDADFTIIRFFVPQISQIYTDLDLFGLWGDADFSSSNTQKKSV